MSDMEISLQNLLKRAFPNSDLQSCYFYYIKNLWDNAQKRYPEVLYQQHEPIF